jgi:transcriptional regulator with XRE-family HTH domain
MQAEKARKSGTSSPFTGAGSAHTLRLRLLMEAQHRMEIGKRIRELRESSTETNRSIADACDVGERTVAGWVAGDGISYKNAKKVAELFDVDIDWLWRGRERGETPDLMARLDGGSPVLNRVEQMCQEIGERLEALEAGQGAIVAEILAALEQMPSATSTSEADRRRRGRR